MLRVGSTYSRILLGLIMTDFILTFIVPSGLARVAILATISLALIEAFQAQKGSNIARGMFLIMTYTGNLFDKMILAGAGSITAAGAMAKFGNVDVLWGQWLFAFLPCSLVTVLIAWRLTLWLYPSRRRWRAARNSSATSSPGWGHGRGWRRRPRCSSAPPSCCGSPISPITCRPP
jgi:di/tricarboxylate transporter